MSGWGERDASSEREIWKLERRQRREKSGKSERERERDGLDRAEREQENH